MSASDHDDAENLDPWGRSADGRFEPTVGASADSKRPEGYWDEDDGVYVLQAIGEHEWVAAEPGSYITIENAR